jgi:hypothetical protein
LRARTNLDYWNAILTSFSQVNLAGRGGTSEKLRAVDLAIEELRRLPTENVDSEFITLGQSTVNLFESIRSYLQENAAAKAVAARSKRTAPPKFARPNRSAIKSGRNVSPNCAGALSTARCS